MDAPWLAIALSFEKPGNLNREEVRGLLNIAGRGTVAPPDERWDAAFVGACLQRAGFAIPKDLTPLSYVKLGESVKDDIIPRGAIVVLRVGNEKDNSLKIGFVNHKRGKVIRVITVGKSYKVVVSEHPLGRVVAIRWPREKVQLKGSIGVRPDKLKDWEGEKGTGRSNMSRGQMVAAGEEEKEFQFEPSLLKKIVTDRFIQTIISGTATATGKLARTDLRGSLAGLKIISAQQLLNVHNYDAGPANGVLGTQTQEALKLFQEHSDLEVSGIPDEKTLESIASHSIGEMQYPVPSKPLKDDPAVADSEEEEDAPKTIDLLFATTRRPQSSNPLEFTDERSDKLIFGKVQVNVPPHETGGFKRPSKYGVLRFFQGGKNKKKFFLVNSKTLVTEEEFIAEADKFGRDDAMVFVHGFDNTFDDAACRMAQIVSDIDFKGVRILFSWPSRGKIWRGYGYDHSSAMFSRQPFLDLLMLLQSKTRIKKIHIVAHSMGNQIVVEALALLASSLLTNVGELILAAPDIDRDIFEQLGPKLGGRARGVTLYASQNDKAMKVSRMNAYSPRAGDILADRGPVVVSGIDTIDVSEIGTDFLGHSPYANGALALNDLGILMSHGTRPPGDRTPILKQVPLRPKPPKYWKFPKQAY